MDSTRDRSAATLAVDVVSDVVCPWCYIGKRRLDAALAELAKRTPETQPVVRWHAFQLNPDLPRSGVDRRAYLRAKFGGLDRTREIHARIDAAARSVGLDFALDRIARQPNTLDAHRLIAWAQKTDDGLIDELVENLFHAYFVEGRDIGDHRELVAVAEASGYPVAAAQTVLDSDRFADDIERAGLRAREIGIGGVPFFIFDGKVGVSGAQEPRTLLEAIDSTRAG